MSAGRLVLDGSALKLMSYNGNKIWIDGVDRVIPASGAVFKPADLASLTPGLWYYIWAWYDEGVVWLYGNGGHLITDRMTDPDTGIEIDPYYYPEFRLPLVGAATLLPTGTWIDTPKYRGVLSWHNRRKLRLENGFTTGRILSSLTLVEIHTEIRLEWLSWVDELSVLDYYSSVWNQTLGLLFSMQINVDDVLMGAPMGTNSQTTGSTHHNAFALTMSQPLSEGYHWATMMGKISAAGNVTYNPVGAFNGVVLG